MFIISYLEKKMLAHSSIFAWRIPWTEEPGRLQYMGLQKSWTRLSDSHSLIISYWYNIKEIEKNLRCDNSKDFFFFYWCIIALQYFVSDVQWSESTICIHKSPFSWTFSPLPTPVPSILVITEQWAELLVLYSRFPLAIYFTDGNVYISVLIFHSSHPCLLPLCPHVCSVCLCFYSCPTNKFICTLLLDSTYMILVFLFLTQFTLYNRL